MENCKQSISYFAKSGLLFDFFPSVDALFSGTN